MTTRVITVNSFAFDAPGLEDFDLQKKLRSEDAWRGAAMAGKDKEHI